MNEGFKKNGLRIRRLLSLALAGVAGLAGGWLLTRRSKDSTKQLARLHGYRLHDFLHGYVYYKWTKYYLKPIRFVLNAQHILPERVYQGLGNQLMHSHHAKVVPPDTARKLIDVKSPIRISNPEQVLPFERARDIVLENAEHIAVIDCPCREIAANPCSPIDVCFVLGKPFTDFVLEHKPGKARRLDVDEALAILEREHGRGRVHTAWFKDAAGDRLYSICNCCSCCCLGFQAVAMGFGLLVSSGSVASIDNAACALCGECANACPFGAITVTAEAFVDEALCKGCGVCVDVCPSSCIELHVDATKPGPLRLS